jgi:MFS family permease
VTFYCGLTCMVAGLIALSFAPSPFWAVAAAALTGFGFSLPWPSIASTVLNRAPDNERAASVGILTACVDLFVGGSSFVDGAVAQRFGYAPLYWMAAGAVCVAAIAGYRVTSPSAEPATVEPLPEPVADLA